MHLCTPQAEYLGLIVDEEQILMDLVKLKIIHDWNPPQYVGALLYITSAIVPLLILI